jgi:hypothetical protein
MTTNLPQDVNDELRQLWKEAGGEFHGPNIETGTMPESKLLPFLRQLRAQRQQGSEPVLYARSNELAEPILKERQVMITVQNVPDDVYDAPLYRQPPAIPDMATEPDGYLYEELSGTKGSFIGKLSENTKWQIKHNDLKVTPFWLTPRATPDMAAAYRKAAEICDDCHVSWDVHRVNDDTIWNNACTTVKSAILAAIPADSEAALREVCMKPTVFTDAELLQFASQEQLFLFADEDDYLSIARGVLELVQSKVNSIIGASDKVEGGK